MAYVDDSGGGQDDVGISTSTPITLENVLDKIADTLIVSPAVNPTLLKQNQKTIRDGLLRIGRINSERLILFEKDTKANREDLIVHGESQDGDEISLMNIIDQFIQLGVDIEHLDVNINYTTNPPSILSIYLENLESGISHNITQLITNTTIADDGHQIVTNALNISQFLNIEQKTQNINTERAEEFLDTTIFELLPGITTRQQRINRFFQEFQNLIGDTPDFQMQNGLVSEEFMMNSGSDLYSEEHDISAAQDTPDIGISEEDSFITRLDDDANSNNEGKTLQSMRETLNTFLEDIDQEFPDPQDERPDYINESSGYLKFRGLNQGIIVRSQASDYIQGLNPDTQEYLTTGFTITAWVKFLDKTSVGTIFNFGNPMKISEIGANSRIATGLGFSLDTFVINKNEDYLFGGGIPTPYEAGVGAQINLDQGGPTWGDRYSGRTFFDGTPVFANSDHERFLRLVVKEADQAETDHNGLRGSHGVNTINVGGGYSTPGERKDALPMWGQYDQDGWGAETNFDHAGNLGSFTRVPHDPTEWYFICATYDPNIDEDASHAFGSSLTRNQDFWNGNVNPSTNEYTDKSGYGSKCKVEIISRTDLLRARGFKV